MDQDDNSPWQYKPDGGKTPQEPENADIGDDETGGEATVPKSRAAHSVSWEAVEFIEHPHGSTWYGLLVISTAVMAVIVYLISKDIFATVIITLVGVIVGVFAGHKPGQVKYEVSDEGLRLNNKLYKYSDFKSFSVFHEGDLSSATLFPLKRFVPPVTAYFVPADEKKIVEAFGNYLPYEDRQLDAVDRLTRRLRL
jgi:hypothetical protein